MSEEHVIEVLKTGPRTVLTFPKTELLDEINLIVYRRQLLELAEQYECRTLVVDLSHVAVIPSGFLGLFSSLRNQGIEIQLLNPSEDVREVLEVTRLNEIMSISEGEVDSVLADSAE